MQLNESFLSAFALNEKSVLQLIDNQQIFAFGCVGSQG